jgi:hypothetical protein
MKFSNQTFSEGITLDYNEFIDCSVQNCPVLYYGGQYNLLRTNLTNVSFGFGGPANRTLTYLRMIYAMNPKLVIDLLEQNVHPPVEQGVTIN